MLHWLDWVAIGVYLVFAIGVGSYLAKRASTSTESFYLAGRTLPWWVAGTSIVATSFAADTPLVVTGWVRTGGIAQNWLWWGMAGGGALSIIVLAAWWRRLQVTTDAEIIEHRYGGRQANALRGFLGAYHALVTNTIVLTWVLLAMKKVVRVVLDLPDDSYDVWIVGGGLALALVYSFLSGLWGVVVTDFFQFFLALLGALLLGWEAMTEMGGLAEARAAFAELSPETTRMIPARAVNPETDTAYGWLEGAAWIGNSFGAFLIFLGLQGWLNKNADGGGPAVQRYSACRDEHHARAAALWYHIAHYALRPWPWIFVALASMVLVDPALLPTTNGGVDHEAAYPYMMKTLLGPGIFGLLCASFLAAFMSTLDTHFNLASAYLVNDCYRRFLVRDAGPRHYVWVGRFLEIAIGALAASLALVADSISDLFTFSLTLLGGLGPAMLLRWFWWRANAWTEISALATSTGVTLVMTLVSWQARAWAQLIELADSTGVTLIRDLARDASPMPEGIPAWTQYPLGYAITIGCSLAVMLTVTLLTPPVDDARLARFAGKIHPVGWWGRFRTDPGSGRGWVVLAGWMGGAALIYGMVFLPGRWLLGQPWWPSLLVALAGAVVLRLCWRRAVA